LGAHPVEEYLQHDDLRGAGGGGEGGEGEGG